MRSFRGKPYLYLLVALSTAHKLNCEDARSRTDWRAIAQSLTMCSIPQTCSYYPMSTNHYLTINKAGGEI